MKAFLAFLLGFWGMPAFADIIVTDLTVTPQASTKLTGDKAERLFNQFNLLKWDGSPGARCHHPAYRIQVLEKGVASIDATICFQCHNVLFQIPKNYGLRGFGGEEKSAADLRESLGKLFKTAAVK